MIPASANPSGGATALDVPPEPPLSRGPFYCRVTLNAPLHVRIPSPTNRRRMYWNRPKQGLKTDFQRFTEHSTGEACWILTAGFHTTKVFALARHLAEIRDSTVIWTSLLTSLTP